MKKTITFLFISYILVSLTNAQYIYFNKRIDITGDWEVCRGIVLTKGGYLVAGGQGEAIVGIYLSKIDSLGNLKWTQYYENPSYSYYFGLSGSLFKTTDNNIGICGSRVPAGPRGYSLLIKTDSLGNKIWEKEYQLLDYSNSLSSGNITKDSGYILTGRIIDPGPRNKYLLIKTDSLGIQQWYKMYTDNDPNRNYEGKCVIQTPDSGYCIGGGGGYWPNGVEYRSVVEIIKTNSIGNQQWKKTYGNPLYANWGAMLCLSSDSCIIGTYNIANTSLPEDDKQLYITKISLDGIEKWNKKISFLAPSNGILWIKTLNDGNMISCGSHFVKDTISKCIGFLFKLKYNGDSIWYREYSIINGIQDQNQLFQVTPTPDSGFVAVGSLFPEFGNQDIWVFKTDSLGCLVPNCTGIGITEFNPTAGAQMLIYPNPFTEAFAINYNIQKESKKGVFQLYDVYGKLVYQIGLTASVNQLQVVASALKPGIYIASLVVDGAIIKTEKIIKE